MGDGDSHLTSEVLELVRDERLRQLRRYGTNDDLADGTGLNVRWALPASSNRADVLEQQFREEYEEYEGENGIPTWMHLVREELAEAFKEDDVHRLGDELVQLAALCVSWVETLRSRDPSEWMWGVEVDNGVVHDPYWQSASDVMKGTHGFGPGPWRVMVSKPGSAWEGFWS